MTRDTIHSSHRGLLGESSSSEEDDDDDAVEALSDQVPVAATMFTHDCAAIAVLSCCGSCYQLTMSHKAS